MPPARVSKRSSTATTAGYIDLADKIGEKLPLVIAIVVVLSFVLLMIAFRSIVIPLTAGLMNLLSVGAAYGILVAVFEKGWGVELIGLDHSTPDRQLRAAVDVRDPLRPLDGLPGVPADADRTSAITSWATTMRRWSRAWRSTARVITSAALIMVAVFASFVLNGDPTVKQFGVGLAAAIAIDATIVRTAAGAGRDDPPGQRRTGGSRASLERHLPRLGIEGEDFLEDLDAEREAA